MNRFKKLFVSSESRYDSLKLKLKEKLRLIKPVIVFPYRGFGNREIVYLHGRVLEREKILHEDSVYKENLLNNIRRMWKSYESDEIPGVGIEGNFLGTKAKAISDEEGYFTLVFQNIPEKAVPNGWHEAEIKIVEMPWKAAYEETTTAEVYYTDEESDFGIISDVDDTILETNVLRPLKMILTTISKSAKQRLPFEGVEDLYQALSRNAENPLFFVSGSSYNLYSMLTEFCDHHNIPKAPFILRDLGIGIKQWIKQDSQVYKFNNIKKVFTVYKNLKFICIGDSGEKDPEVYLEIHRRFPGRVLAIYIRHVSSDERKSALEKIVESLDIPFLIMKDSHHALEHARKNGWA
jgi:phosphatidate phosphatase APP1